MRPGSARAYKRSEGALRKSILEQQGKIPRLHLVDGRNKVRVLRLSELRRTTLVLSTRTKQRTELEGGRNGKCSSTNGPPVNRLTELVENVLRSEASLIGLPNFTP